MNLPKIAVICGPTATGKSGLAVELARKFNGEIVSADSRQVYKGLDIGSGKVTKREMKGIRHHLLDVADPRKARYTVDDYVRDAEEAIALILSRGKLPIVCGGTGFYIDVLVNGDILPDVPASQALRKSLSKRSAKDLMKELRRIDPRRAKDMDPYNKVRIIRAIEVARALGKVPKVRYAKRYNALPIGLMLDKSSLKKNIHDRLLKRIKAGMVLEIAKLHADGLSWKRMHDFGLEYRYITLYLQKKLSKEETLIQLENEIVRYAKRQMQWFKRNKKIRWLSPTDLSGAIRETKRFISPGTKG